LPISLLMPARRAFATICIVLLALTPLHAQSRVIELNDAGWKALRDGYHDKAAALFDEALTLRPNDPVLLMGSGVAAHERGLLHVRPPAADINPEPLQPSPA